MGDVQQPAGLQVGNRVRSGLFQHLSEIADGLPGPLRLGVDAALSDGQDAAIGVCPQAAVPGLPDPQVRHPKLEAQPDGQIRAQQVLDLRQQFESGVGMLQGALLVAQLELLPAQVEMEPPAGHLGKESGLFAAGLHRFQFRPQVACPEVPQHRVAIGNALPEFLQDLQHFPVAGPGLLADGLGTATLNGCRNSQQEHQDRTGGSQGTAGPPRPPGNWFHLQSPSGGGFRWFHRRNASCRFRV